MSLTKGEKQKDFQIIKFKQFQKELYALQF